MKFSEGTQIPVLLYHRVVPRGGCVGRHKIWVWEPRFVKQMEYLKREGFHTLTFEDLASGNLPPAGDPAVIITFDDGYIDNYEHAFRIMKPLGFKAVVFLVTGLKRNEWGIAEGEPAFEMMTSEMIKEMMAAGFEFGGHTRLHKDLSKLDPLQIESEISGCLNDVRTLTGKLPLSFAYPFGAVNDQIKNITKRCGFSYGIATNTGPGIISRDPFQIRRFEISPKTRMASFRAKVSGTYLSRKSLFKLFTSK